MGYTCVVLLTASNRVCNASNRVCIAVIVIACIVIVCSRFPLCGCILSRIPIYGYDRYAF
jgi:hypothetical protein